MVNSVWHFQVEKRSSFELFLKIISIERIKNYINICLIILQNTFLRTKQNWPNDNIKGNIDFRLNLFLYSTSREISLFSLYM